MHQNPGMPRPRSAAAYWSSPGIADAFVDRNQTLLRYEEDLVRTAAGRATASGPVDRIHVMGVGGGRELPAVRAVAPEAEVFAWDISPAMVDRCRTFVDRAGLDGVHVEVGDLTDLEPAGTPADLVIGINAVCCYLTSRDARRRGATTMADLLRPGGAVAIVVQQRNGRPDWATWFALRALVARLGLAPGEPGDRVNGHGEDSLLVHHYGRGELRQMFTAAGFDTIHIESLRHWGRRAQEPVPLRSPNPLLMTAVRAADPPP